MEAVLGKEFCLLAGGIRGSTTCVGSRGKLVGAEIENRFSCAEAKFRRPRSSGSAGTASLDDRGKNDMPLLQVHLFLSFY